MHIVFGIHLDGLQPRPPHTAAGVATLGPRGLIEVLETQLGLPAPDAHPSESAFVYLRCLREATSPQRFFHRSLEVDPVNVARTLLRWREQWYEAGWDGTFTDGAAPRLSDMAAVEELARDRVPLRLGQRLQRISQALADRSTQIARVELHTPLEDFPRAWRNVLDVLPCEVAPGLELSASGRPGSDLALVQTGILTLAGGDEVEVLPRAALRGDGSLLVVKSASRDLSADAIAEFLLASGEGSTTLLVTERDGTVLDNALERAGLPRCGFSNHTQFRAATQVLKLALALLWEPVDPHRLLQFLVHPAGPLPAWVRSRLAGAVAESPGIGGPKWVEALGWIERTQRERQEATEQAVRELQGNVAFWLEGERHDPRSGAPLDTLVARIQRVASWAAMRLNSSANGAEATLFSAAHAQAEALLVGLHDLAREHVPRLELERLIDEVNTDAPDPSFFGEAGHVRATASPGAVTSPWPTVVWWNLAPLPTGVSYPWSRRELAALREAGVHLPEIENLIRSRSREWLRPICNATERLVLAVHDDEGGAHPVRTQLEYLFEGFEKIEIEPALLRRHATLRSLGVDTRPLPLNPLPAPRRWWTLPEDCIPAPRETESYSSLSALCDYPHEWVLQHAARLETGRAAEVMDGSRLFGNLGHRLFEEFFRMNGNWLEVPEADVRTWVGANLLGLIEREGAVLLGPGRGMERVRVLSTLERALVVLLEQLRVAGVEHVSPEASREAPFEDCRLTGSIDLALTGAQGAKAVLDVKWARQNDRRDLLAANRALQLATYAYLQKTVDGSPVWPEGAYFILESGNVVASNQGTFPDAIVAAPADGDGVSDLWGRVAVTYRWRWMQLERGRIEVVTDSTEPDDDSTPPVAGLEPVSGGDRYDDFTHLAGWEDSR